MHEVKFLPFEKGIFRDVPKKDVWEDLGWCERFVGTHHICGNLLKVGRFLEMTAEGGYLFKYCPKCKSIVKQEKERTKVVSVRGAITAEENSKEKITANTIELFSAMLRKNNILTSDIIFVLFSMTKDLDACFPAEAVRSEYPKLNMSLLCFNEIDVQGALQKCIRIMIHAYCSNKNIYHVYLKDAKKLRPDLNDDNEKKFNK